MPPPTEGLEPKAVERETFGVGVDDAVLNWHLALWKVGCIGGE
jgi:hypothetical protein